MDFIEGLLKSGGWDTILVEVDRFTKYGHFVGLEHPFTAVLVATAFVKEFVKLRGLPASIVSDRDKVFMSYFWREPSGFHGTFLKWSTAYHPQRNGYTEIVKRPLRPEWTTEIVGQVAATCRVLV